MDALEKFVEARAVCSSQSYAGSPSSLVHPELIRRMLSMNEKVLSVFLRHFPFEQVYNDIKVQKYNLLYLFRHCCLMRGK